VQYIYKDMKKPCVWGSRVRRWCKNCLSGDISKLFYVWHFSKLMSMKLDHINFIPVI